MVILAVSTFVLRSTYHMTKGKSPGQTFFGQYMILPINHVADWRYIRQLKQAQIDNDVIQENDTIIYHNYRVVDQVMKLNHSAYKYETPYRNTYKIVQTFTNGTATLGTGAVTTILNIRKIKPYNNPNAKGLYPEYSVHT